ncbi:MAG: MgtC/SapB family protein [Gemmataceae bacterium]|nr:MgtC/SapB family protein [Gemmataceae bacterium]
MDLQLTLQKLAIALALGLLVGLQRERARSRVAGIRTFGLITLLGAVAALLANDYGGWLLAAEALGLALLLAGVNLMKPRGRERDLGLTTEVAALLMFGVGAYVVVGHTAVAVILGGSVALLLHFKAPMHAFVAKIGDKDVTAIMRFVLIALVILPALPDDYYGPYAVLNPHKIWFMVVLIVGINLAGYVAYKLLGGGTGALLAGVLGGMVSSTATTVSYARRTREQPESAGLSALVILIASTIVYVRMLVEIGIAAPGSFWVLAPPIGVMLGWMVGIAAIMFLLVRRDQTALSEPGNPAELLPALLFAGLYAVVVLAIAWAKDHFDDAGLYVVAFFSGMHDVDAITLSTAQYVDSNAVAAAVGWRAMLWGSMVNLFMKGFYAYALGGWRLLRALLAPFVAALAGGGALLLLWPA